MIKEEEEIEEEEEEEEEREGGRGEEEGISCLFLSLCDCLCNIDS